MVKLMRPTERSRAVALVFGGGEAGSVLGLLLCPPLVATFGWPSVFYLFGIVLVFKTHFHHFGLLPVSFCVNEVLFNPCVIFGFLPTFSSICWPATYYPSNSFC
jgi:MFS family permease